LIVRGLCVVLTLGETALTSITEDTIELFFASTQGGPSGIDAQQVRAARESDVPVGDEERLYLARNPVADSESIRREKHAKRDGWLVADVLNDLGANRARRRRAAMLAVASPDLQRLIIGALETGLRRGELLALQWRDVNLERKESLARTAPETFMDDGPASKASKDNRAAFLARCYVFGDEAALQVGDVKRAWETAVLKARAYAAVDEEQGPGARFRCVARSRSICTSTISGMRPGHGCSKLDRRCITCRRGSGTRTCPRPRRT
jgi:hypothetical protein